MRWFRQSWWWLPVLIYLPFLGGPLVWDDHVYLVAHPFTWRFHPWDAFLPSRYFAAGYPESSAYHALSTATHMVDYALWGLAPLGHRLPNLALHVLNLCLLRRFLVTHDVAPGAAGWAVLLFGVHPALSETQFCAYFRHDPLAATWMLLALRAHAADRTGGTIAAAGLALLTKEPAVAVAPLCVLYDAWVRPREASGAASWWTGVRWARAAALTALLVAYAGLRAVLLSPQFDWTKFHPEPAATVFIGWLNALAALPVAALEALLPVRLSVYYDLPLVHSPAEPRVWLGAALAAGGVALIAWTFRRNRLAAFGMAWAGLTYLPTAHLLPAAGYRHFMAERYLYLPLLGAAMAGSVALARTVAWRAASRRVLAGLLGLLVAAAVVRIADRAQDWRDPVRLCRRDVDRFPQRNMLGALAEAYRDAGDLPRAVDTFREFLRRQPRHDRAWMELGVCLKRLGRFPEAEDAYRRALKIVPEDPRLRYNLGVLMGAQGRDAEAVRWYREALARAPRAAEWWRVLGAAYFRLGRVGEAEAAFTRYRQLGGAPPRQP